MLILIELLVSLSFNPPVRSKVVLCLEPMPILQVEQSTVQCELVASIHEFLLGGMLFNLLDLMMHRPGKVFSWHKWPLNRVAALFEDR